MTVPQNEQEACEADVVGTVSYFIAVRLQPTRSDIWTWLYRPKQTWTLLQVEEAIDRLVARAVLQEVDGYLGVAGELDGARRQQQYLHADRGYRRVRWLAAYVGWIPGVRALAVCNTLAWEATHPGGDLDVCVIGRPGTLWFVRMACVVPLMLLRLRPGHKAAFPIDFTFFLADTHLDVEDLQLPGEDPGFAYWIRSFVPLCDDGVMEAFWTANRWAQERLPNSVACRLAWYRRLPSGYARLQRVWTHILWRTLRATGLMWILNTMARRLSLWWFPATIRERMNRDTCVVVQEDVLKFHTRDRRAEVRDRCNDVFTRLMSL